MPNSPQRILQDLRSDRVPHFAAGMRLVRLLRKPRQSSTPLLPANHREVYQDLFTEPNLYEPYPDRKRVTALLDRLGSDRERLSDRISERIGAGRLEGADYLFLRRLVFFLAFGGRFDQWERLLHPLSSNHQADLFVTAFVGLLAGGYANRATGIIRMMAGSHSELSDYVTTHERELRQLSTTLADYAGSYDEAVTAGVLFREAEATASVYSAQKKPLAEYDFYAGLIKATPAVQVNFLLAYLRRPGAYRGWPGLHHSWVDRLVKIIEWTPTLLINFLTGCSVSQGAPKLPKLVGQLLERELVSADSELFEALAYYHRCLLVGDSDHEPVEQLLRTIVRRDYEVNDGVVPPQLLPYTGCIPPALKGRDNYVKNPREDQVRCWVRLLRAVVEIELVKFLRRPGEPLRVQLRFRQELHVLEVTDDPDVGITDPLNSLLYEAGIGYQIVQFASRATTPVRVMLLEFEPFAQFRITLINQATYRAHAPLFDPYYPVRFADPSAPAFTLAAGEIAATPVATDPDFELPGWEALLVHCKTAPAKSLPSVTWTKQARQLVADYTDDGIWEEHLTLVTKLLTRDEWLRSPVRQPLLRGLLWLSCLSGRKEHLYLLQRAASLGYRKVPGGPLNAKLGSLALDALASIGTLEAYGITSTLLANTNYTVAKRAITNRQRKFKTLRETYSEDDLLELSVSDQGLRDGVLTIPIGEYTARVKANGLRISTQWVAPDGKLRKSTPAAVKTAAKQVRDTAKQLREALRGQARRLESTWMSEQTWSAADWTARYANHELLRVLAQGLIWRVEAPTGIRSGILKEDRLVDSAGESVPLTNDASVRLWHPARAVSTEEVMAWRNYLFAKRIVQPFKQAFREVYLLTPAEEITGDHSIRFSGHQLVGNTLYALGKGRGWTMAYEDPPLLKVPGGRYLAQLYVTGQILYGEPTTSDLRFFSTTDPTRRASLPLADVPVEVLSEVMRDVDLFVAVAGLGHLAQLPPGATPATTAYWHRMALGTGTNTKSAAIRYDLLERLLPMLKIASRCSLDGNYLRVTGNLHRYRINLGSGNILMEPHDQYLCIVGRPKTRRKQQVWLPFEDGDTVLTLILSKAFLLAADDEITDPAITRQFGRT